MSSPTLRFVHASDFHFEQTPYGIADVPTQLRDAFVDAAFSAVEKLVDAVLAEEAEFLVLSGDILAEDDIGPRSLLFLVQQFERLADRHIPVYWSPGPSDPPDESPTAAMFPENVHRLTREKGEWIHQVDGQPRARLIGGAGRAHSDFQATDFDYKEDGLFTIAVAYGHGQSEREAMVRQPIDYWALGGAHQRRTVHRAPTIHYPGSPQGRCPAETGPHGCTLVEVDAGREVVTSPLITDVLRWQTEEVAVDGSTDVASLEQLLRDHLQRLVVNSAAQHLLVSWKITGTGPLIGALGREAVVAEILSKLRSEFGSQTPCVWTVDLVAEPPSTFPSSWYEEESMLGEFLRNVQDLQTGRSESLDVFSLLDGPLADEIAPLVELSGTDSQAYVLRRAAAVGAQMLRGDDERHV